MSVQVSKTLSAREGRMAYETDSRIAYFSMEIAVDAHFPTYAGGLGVLAGDTLRSAADYNQKCCTECVLGGLSPAGCSLWKRKKRPWP